MSVKMRQKVEREICTTVVDALLAAGFTISINNGDDADELSNATDKAKIVASMFLTDDEYLMAIRNDKVFGWVRFIYGNDGPDVMSDYTTNLEPFIGAGTAVEAKINQYAD